MKRFNAFTLAEVLITLTIIGVIAVITIPNLMQSYRKHQVEVGVKEAYSIISNAVKMAIAENGQMNEWSGSRPLLLYHYLKKQHMCNSDRIKNQTGKCFKNTTENGFGWWYRLGRIPFYDGAQASYFYQAKLNNGMDIGITDAQTYKPGNDNEPGLIFVVDVNGQNTGSTMVGEDIFMFFVPYDTGIVETYKSKSLANNINSILTGSNLGSCNTKNNWSGFSCSRAIQLNGWKIPDDYPVKKW